MTEISLVSYGEIAHEYYDPLRHPTCVNFREASSLILGRWLQASPHQKGLFCEVGAGKSLLAELLAGRVTEADLVIADSSPSMLSYSQRWADGRVRLVVADSAELPLANGSLDLLVSSLGDPYNDFKFWEEARRVLRPGGQVFFTTPSYDWAISFRGRGHANGLEHAEFELLNGERVYVPSMIYQRDKQTELIEKAGLVVKEYAVVTLSEMTSSPLSPKLLPGRGLDASVVEGYRAVKP